MNLENPVPLPDSPPSRSNPRCFPTLKNGTSSFLILLCILTWFILSTAVSVFNKEILDPKHLNFTAPIAATAIQSFLHCILVSLIVHVFYKSYFVQFNASFSHVQFRKKEFLYLITTALFYCADIALSNASYRSLSISSYIMVKNSVPIFVLLFSFLFGLESITFQLIFILLTILGGVAFSVSDQVSYEGRDLFLVLLASVFSGLRWTLTQLLLSFQSSSSTHPSLICIETLYKLAPWSSLFLTLTSLLVETYPTFTVSPFLFGFLILSGCLSFAMVLCEYIVVHFTSVLAFSIAGIAKESIILLASMLIFGDRMTLMNIIGLLISLLGILWFNLYRARSTTPGEESHEFKLVPVDSIEENIDSLE